MPSLFDMFSKKIPDATTTPDFVPVIFHDDRMIARDLNMLPSLSKEIPEVSTSLFWDALKPSPCYRTAMPVATTQRGRGYSTYTIYNNFDAFIALDSLADTSYVRPALFNCLPYRPEIILPLTPISLQPKNAFVATVRNDMSRLCDIISPETAFYCGRSGREIPIDAWYKHAEALEWYISKQEDNAYEDMLSGVYHNTFEDRRINNSTWGSREYHRPNFDIPKYYETELPRRQIEDRAIELLRGRGHVQIAGKPPHQIVTSVPGIKTEIVDGGVLCSYDYAPPEKELNRKERRAKYSRKKISVDIETYPIGRK